MQTRQIAGMIIAVAFLAIALGTALGYGISSARNTTTLTKTQILRVTPTSNLSMTPNLTVTLTETIVLPDNAVVTKIIILQEYQLYPVVYSTNCGIQHGGSVGTTSSNETSYVATTTALSGTTLTTTTTTEIISYYEYTNNDLAYSTQTMTIGNSEITTTLCYTIS